MNQEDKHLILQKVSLLQVLEPPELEYILPFVKLLSFPPNTTLIAQGKPGDGMYIIKAGRVQVNVRLPGNIENKIATLTAQDFFGEVTLIDGGIATASVFTLTKTQCYFISTEYFKMFQLCAPLIAYKITKAINHGVSARLHYINHQIAGRLIDIKNINSYNTRLKPSKPIPATFNNLERLGINTEFLTNLGVFNYFKQTEIKELFAYLKVRKITKGCLLFSEKEPADAFYIVAQGAVQMSIVKNNKISKLSIAGPGGIFGLLSYFDHNIHTATATAREETIALEFKHAHMEMLQTRNILLFYKWYSVISQTLIMMLRAADKDLIRLASRLS